MNNINNMYKRKLLDLHSTVNIKNPPKATILSSTNRTAVFH